jgi:hypothetical protein
VTSYLGYPQSIHVVGGHLHMHAEFYNFLMNLLSSSD